MGKLPTGILTGQTIIFGDYDQCMGISHSSDSHTIEGQFCGMALKAPDAVVGLVCAVCARARARVCVCVCVCRLSKNGDHKACYRLTFEQLS